MVRSRPTRKNESRESRFENLADLKAAYIRVAEDPTVESCSVDVPNRTLPVQLESEVRPPPLRPRLFMRPPGTTGTLTPESVPVFGRLPRMH